MCVALESLFAYVGDAWKKLVSSHSLSPRDRADETRHDAETTLLESSSSKTIADTIYDVDVASLIDEEDDDTSCCITGYSQARLTNKTISNNAQDVQAHVAETLLDEELEEISMAPDARILHSETADAEEPERGNFRKLDDLDNLTNVRQPMDIDTISDASSTDVEIESHESPKMSHPSHGSSLRGIVAPSGWLHKRCSKNIAARPRRTTRVAKSNIPAPMKQDWNLRHPSTWAWPEDAVSVPTSKSDVSKTATLDSSRKKRVAKLKQDSRFQELRARIAQKNHALSPGVVETPSFESQTAVERMVATPLRRIDAIERPPKYRNEVWFRKR